MIITTENEFFTLGVKEDGAELSSLKSKLTGREYIWCGNTDIWYGQAPILFPFVGRLLDDKYRVNGKEYTCAKHGIVRKKPFTLTDKSDGSITMIQTDDAQSLEMYPYHFKFTMKYSLNGDTLVAEHTIENTNDCVMYFSVGAHPGFSCAVGDTVSFPVPETVYTERIDADSILTDEKTPVLENGQTITITDGIFERDALILSGYKSDSVLLRGDGYSVNFTFGNAPMLGIWAKPAAPYVCLEPWYGVNDSRDKKDDLSQKRGILSLEAGKSFSFTWTAQCR